ncbi:MAG TPA: ABC transporter substrate binding protein [Thiobacillaceae bacterium]
MLGRLRRIAGVVGVAFGGLLPVSPAQAGQGVCLLLSDSGGVYQTTAETLARELGRNGGDWQITTATLGDYAANGSDLTVAIGTEALKLALAQPDRPVLSLLVPRQTYERLAAGRQRVTALYLDQPLSRQMRLLAVALPELTKAGAPLGPVSRGLRPALRSAARDTGIALDTAVIEEGTDLYGALNELAEDSQAFVLLPDPVVMKPGTLQNFFLHTYRLKKPVLAYSAPLVQSGAMLALYTTPAQQGREAAGWISESWGGGEFRFGAPRYPRLFAIGVNRSVARSLGIALPSEDVLSQRLEAAQ